MGRFSLGVGIGGVGCWDGMFSGMLVFKDCELKFILSLVIAFAYLTLYLVSIKIVDYIKISSPDIPLSELQHIQHLRLYLKKTSLMSLLQQGHQPTPAMDSQIYY